MAVKTPIVLNNGQQEQLQPGDYIPVDVTSFITHSSFFDDFTSFALWRVSLSGGSINNANEALGEVNISALTTATSATGSSSIQRGAASGIVTLIGLYAIEYGAKCRIPVLSTTTDEFACYISLSNSPFVSSNVNIGFYYDRVTDGNFWSVHTRNFGLVTKTVTSIPVVADTQYKFKCTINATGTQVDFYIAIGATGLYTLVATHTTNIPLGQSAAPTISIIKSAGTTVRNLYMDYWYNKSTNVNRTI